MKNKGFFRKTILWSPTFWWQDARFVFVSENPSEQRKPQDLIIESTKSNLNPLLKKAEKRKQMFELGPEHILTPDLRIDDPVSMEAMTIDGEEVLLIVEREKIKVYSLTNYQLINEYGRKGNGPGELTPYFEIPLQIHLNKDKISVNSDRKIIHLKAGMLSVNLPFVSVSRFFLHPEKEKRLNKKSFFLQLVPVDNKYAAVRISFSKKKGASKYNQVVETVLLDENLFPRKNAQGEEIILTSRERVHPKARGGKIIVPEVFPLVQVDEGKIYVFDGESIKRFDCGEKFTKNIDSNNSSTESLISFNSEDRVSVPKIFEKYVAEHIRIGTNTRNFFQDKSDAEILEKVKFPDYFPPVQNMLVKDGYIFIQTYKKESYDWRDKELGGKYEFKIYNLNGQLLKKVFLPVDDIKDFLKAVGTSSNYTFHKGKFIYLHENLEDEEWELREIDLKLPPCK